MRFTITFIMLAASAIPVNAIVVGQVDTFDAGFQNWSTAASMFVLNGGPNGVNDKYLHLSSNGQQFSSGLLRTENWGSQWAGQYVTAGVTGIGVDLFNPGSTPLDIRIVFNAGNYGRFASSGSFILPADSAWYNAVFSIAFADLTPLIPFSDFTTAIEHISAITIHHQPGAPADFGPLTAGVLGIDNVMALPEPAPAIMLIIAAMFFQCRRIL